MSYYNSLLFFITTKRLTFDLKSELNAVLFVLELCRLLCKKNKKYKYMHFKKNFGPEKYLYNIFSTFFFFYFIWMIADTIIIMAG